MFLLIFAPYPHLRPESCIMNKISVIANACKEMKFLQKLKGVTKLDKIRKNTIRDSLNMESLLVRIERSQLRWFGHESTMPQEPLPKQTLYAKVNGKRPV